MPRRTVLSSSQRERFERLPSETEELVRHYSLSGEDMALIFQRREERNRLGFAVQLCLLRHPGRTLEAGEQVPEKLVAFVAEQTGDDPSRFPDYLFRRDQTRRAHAVFLIGHFEFDSYSEAKHAELLAGWLAAVAAENPESVFLVGAALNELKRRRILRPSLGAVERVVAAARTKAEQAIFHQVAGRLGERQRQALGLWLATEAGKAQSRYAWIHQPPGRSTPAEAARVLEKLEAIASLRLPETLLDGVSEAWRGLLAAEGKRASVHNLCLLAEDRRLAVASARLLEARRELVDEVIGIHDQIAGKMASRCQTKLAQDLGKQNEAIKKTIRAFSELGEALIQAREAGEEAWPAIDKRFGWEEFRGRVAEARCLASEQKLDALDYMAQEHATIRRYAPAMLEGIDFQAASGGRDLLEALEALRAMNRAEGRKLELPQGAPTAFVPPRWRAHVFGQEGKPDRRLYELCAMSELRARLRSGDVWAPRSDQHQDFDSYLIGAEAFEKLRVQGGAPVAVETDFASYLAQRREQYESRLDKAQRLARRGKLEGVDIEGGQLRIKQTPSAGVSSEARRFVQKVAARLPRVKITDLLAQVDSWTGFSDQFAHAATGFPCEDKHALLAVVLSHGINLGLARMAGACPSIPEQLMARAADWHVREECYARALAELANRQAKRPLAQVWGDGTTSSSDGQRLAAGGVGKARGQVNARYGPEPGVVVYTHISDQYAPFFVQLINATARDATYVLDGLLYHGSSLDIQEHYTDTHGFTDQVFALCHLLGFRFAPRIRDLDEARLYALEGKSWGGAERWPKLSTLFAARPLNIKEMERSWEDALRLASSIRLGSVTASLIVRKLASYPRQNRLACATREIGRLERSIFLLDWALDPALRARATAGLNKGEARNALAKAVFFNRRGEIRDRSWENQQHRASGLNLVVAAIILWNTVRLEEAVEEERRASGLGEVPQEWLAALSPLGWEHINLTGDYTWSQPADSRLLEAI